MGNIYLVKQERGQDFTQDDEETLFLLASQAALVISNARRHRGEQRARCDMETQIDTCPVGVAVLNAMTGEPASFNRGAGRIVSGLLEPGRAPEELLPVSPDPVDPTVLADQARNNFLSGGGMNVVHIDVEPELPLVMTDRRRIVQALGNPLSNAANHSTETSPIQVASLMEREKPHLMLLDLMLPGTDGIDLRVGETPLSQGDTCRQQ